MLQLHALVAVIYAAMQAIEPPSPPRTNVDRDPNFIIPAVEIAGISFGLNALGKFITKDSSFVVTRNSIRQNARRAWHIDPDPFEINQIGHPYMGAIFQTTARSAGLNFWQSAAYTFFASASWEVAGEATQPSINDQIATGIGGTFLGEALFRSAHLLLETSNGQPTRMRRLLTFGLAPGVAVNRSLFGTRFDDIVPSFGPAYDARASMGAQAEWRRTNFLDTATSAGSALLDASIEYGLPGDPAYRYSRPFDYYFLRAAVSTTNLLEALSARGLLAGGTYGLQHGSGIWGLYGAYEYMATSAFRSASTSLLAGTSLGARMSESSWAHVTVAGGIGYAGVDEVNQLFMARPRYGLAPIVVATARFSGDRFAVDGGVHTSYISRIAAFETSGRDLVTTASAMLAIRLTGQHAISVRYGLSQRDAFLVAGAQMRDRSNAFGVYYTWVGPQGFGGFGRLRRQGSGSRGSSRLVPQGESERPDFR